MKVKKSERRAARQMCSDFVQVSFEDQNGRKVSDVGLLEDVSRHGVNISLNIPLPEGQSVELKTRDFSGQARVCYCNIGDYAYLAGLEFADGYEWSREMWEPKHLLTVPPSER